MSTRKSSVAVGGKVENSDTANDKDKEASSNIIDEDDKANVTGIESIVSAKIETETSNRASTPIQKETSKAVSASGGVVSNTNNNNSRVTRNSPLLISPNAKKEHLGGDSEPTNSESEDGGQAKKQIRGRKSIKEAKESAAKEQATKENLTKPTEVSPIESKDKNQISINENKDKEEEKEKDTQTLKDSKESKEKSVKDIRKDVEETQVKDCKETIDAKDHEHLHAKDSVESNDKDLKDLKENKEISRDPKESKEKDTKDSKETKDKDLKETKDPKEVAAVTNRLTRNAAAQEVASKSRITRNRQSSAGSSTRPETPPTGRRGRIAANATRKPAESAVIQKRKRSIEESMDSPLSKVIKAEPKDISETLEEDDLSSISIPLSGNTDLEGVRIKQELIESDDAASMTTDVISGTIATTATSTTTTGRGRGRWPGRKPTQTASPSTRSTRQNKVASPVTSSSPVPERKRRRTTGGNKRGSSLSKNTGSLHTIGTTNATPDEDSKDSMASSMDDILLADIKLEKLTPELEDNQDVEMEMKKPFEEDIHGNIEIMEQTPIEPLSVNTETQVIAATQEEDDTSTTTTTITATIQPIEASTSSIASKCLNKDASLSPELISEGVSEISVKQFYNRPKFLENNLGIEEDPKLGEIVQKVTITDCASKEVIIPQTLGEVVQKVTITDCTSKEITIPQISESKEGDNEVIEELPDLEISDDIAVQSNNLHDESFSAESIREGDLVYEESNDGKKTPLNEQKITSPTVDLTPLKEEIIEEKSTAKDLMEFSDTADIYSELKQEEDSLGERLVMVEEDLDDDDVTVEESETISMDNNPSLHDDAQEEEEEDEAGGQNVEDDSRVDELVNDLNDVIVPDNATVEEFTNEETKQTSNVCDIEKAKLQVEEEKLEMRKKEIKEKEHEVLKIENKYVDCKKPAEKGKEDENLEKNIFEDIPNKSETIAQLPSTFIINDLKSEKPDNKLNVETLKPIEIKYEERKNKSIIVTKFDSDEKEPISLTEKVAVEKIVCDKPTKIDTSCEKRRLSSTKLTELMEVDELKEEQMIIEETVKEEKQHLLKQQTTIKKMDISDSETTKYENSPPNTSNSNSPIKLANREQRDSKDEDVNSIKSTQSTTTTDANSWTTIEPDYDDEEKLRLKEQHLKNLGLLTHKAAEERRLEFIQTAAAIEATRAAATVSHHHSKRNGNKSTSLANSSNNSSAPHEYTGTLKTVIKLNRNSSGTAISNTTAITVTTASTSNGNSGRKSHITNSKDNNSGVRRQSLKMTFQKGRGRGHTAHGTDRTGSAYSGANSGDHNEHGEDSYYTIQNENEDSSHSEGHHDGAVANALSQTSIGIISHKKDDREEILIPEKASSFKFHPGRLCEDQCYYCSGKFGLYDTPCHVGQIKSVERQQKILKNEEKLTVDNCLCDACFRHVDRRANVPSYKKRLSASGHLENINASGEGHAEDGGILNNAEETEGARKCVVPDCGQSAPHSLRRKCIRKSVKKFLLNFDMPTGSPYIWLCQSHYNAVIQCSGCVLCKRRLGKNHMYHITSDTERLEKALTDMGIPVQLGIGTAVCKLCRYFANLLMKPPDSTKSQKAEFVKNYRKRLLQFHNIHDGSNDASEADEDENNQNSSTTNDAVAPPSIKGSKTTSTRRVSKDQVTANSPTASSSSSVICMTENAVDHREEVSSRGNVNEKSQKNSTLLENEVLMDYGISTQNSSGETSHDSSKSPIPSPAVENEKQSSRLKAILQNDGKSKSNTTKKSDLPCVLLRSNPNLSMRELFPGEEDLGLNFKAPFGSSNSQRTPEGWTRVQTFLQYDEPTRRLWEELQKPYGNQSSFLRHLILLEKYYRNGDLVLSANASSNASVYTQTVRQRLNSFDQGHCGGLDEVISTKSPPPATKENTKSSDIPLVEINDDDDDDIENGIDRSGDDSKTQQSNKVDDDDDDVIMEETPTSVEKNPAKRRTRSVSVDKLTRQLSTNAVTIIARPKDSTQNASTSSSKNAHLDSAQKRVDLSKLQTTTSANTYNTNISSTLAPPSSVTMATITTSVAPSSIASSSSTSSSSSNSRSILKSNLLGIANNKSVEILPIATQKSSGNANTVTATTINIPAVSLDSSSTNISGSSSSSSSGTSKQQKILEVANKLRESQMEAAAAAAAAAKQQNSSILASPPELVSLQRRNASHATSSGSATNTSSTMSSTTASLINAKRPHLMPNRPTSHNRGSSSSGIPPNVVILPNTLSSHERAESKSWRPTLMSVEDNQHLLNKNGPLYQTADGRRLPGLVQVQSGGKPFLISIFDYNRMCILRREKLMRDGMLNSGKHKSQHQQQRHMQQSSNYSKMNNSGNSSGSSSNSSGSSSSKHAQTNAAQQQFMQMLQFQKQQQQVAAMKAATNANNNRYHPIAPKPPSLNTNSSTTNLMPGSSSNNTGSNMNMNNVSNNSRLTSNQPNFPMPLLANALSSANANAAAAAVTLNNNPWLWSNFPDAHELLRNGAHGGLNKLPPLLPKPATVPSTSMANNLAPPSTITSKQLQQHQQHHQQQMLLDNTLMSKIPKSLTVIPQHKLMGSGSNAATKE